MKGVFERPKPIDATTLKSTKDPFLEEQKIDEQIRRDKIAAKKELEEARFGVIVARLGKLSAQIDVLIEVLKDIAKPSADLLQIDERTLDD